MKKKIGLISIISIIGICVIVFFVFMNKTIAEIPATSSYVPTHKDFTVHFTKPMDPATFTNETVIVKKKNGEQILTKMEWNASYTVLTIRAPENGYGMDEEYRITISDKVKTASGKKLSREFVYDFTAVADLPKIKDEKQLVTLLKERVKKNEDHGVELSDAKSESSDSGSDMMESASSNDSVGEGNGTSSTNVQVDGVDEADIIKTDGNSIFFVRDGDIIITSAKKENSKVIGQIKMNGYSPQEIYLYNGLLITVGHKAEPLREFEEPKESTDSADKKIGIPEPIYYSQTAIYIYDIKDPKEPKKIREVSHEGYYSNSRILDGYLYLMANEYPPYHILETREDLEVRPYIKDSATGDTSRPVDFDDMYFFPESKDEQFLILTSVNLKDLEKEAHIETYLGASEQIYMSHNNLYIAVNKYMETEKNQKKTKDDATADIMIWRPQDVDTEITQFNIHNGKLKYNASTVVNGTLINQFAMDERDNTFRVATTKGDSWNKEEKSTNNIYTFDMNLNPLGSVEGLAEGERIYSVRFMEHVAYMVTFKQVDPLFVIDLKDPKNPKVLGELKIPGFSNYLHPLDENHVIGFGQNTTIYKEKGVKEPLIRSEGIKISVFDVSDPTNPKEKFSEVVGQGGSYSELLHNHKVLFKHPTENLFGFPASLSETKLVTKDGFAYEEYFPKFEGALLFKITPEDGIELVQSITHQKNVEEYPEWESEIRRLVSVNDTIYTFSIDQMKAFDLKQKQVIKTVKLPEISYDR
jgi:inhibitor of cysteine peptidase